MSFVKNLLKKKILGVSLGGALGAATGVPGFNVLGSKVSGANPLQDATAGARNAAAIVPFASKFGGGTVTGGGGGGDTAGGGIPGNTPIEAGRGGVPAAIGPMAQSGGDPSRFRSVMEFLSKHKNDILDYGSAAEMLAQQHRKNKMQDELIARARADDPRRQALRTAGTDLLMDNSTPDTSAIFNDPNDPGNPANRYRRVNVGSRI